MEVEVEVEAEELPASEITVSFRIKGEDRH